jgi:YYY domain-containing protein
VDTILRDLLSFLSWYLAATVLGLLAFPLGFKYLSVLRDRGYTFMRVLGLLVWGYLFWLLTSLGVLQNTTAGLILALIILVLISGLVIRKSGLREIISWLGNNRKLIIASELLFLLTFALWAFIRSANPDITGTEKPMELAFINSILRSPGLPPSDPWLSGYAISYYYFGYVMVAMLTRLTGVLPGVGFNLAIAMWFALSASGAYGVVYNLLALTPRRGKNTNQTGIYSLPLFGPLFLLIVSNLEGFLEVLHAGGLFWKKLADGSQVSVFWSWLDILDLSVMPVAPLSWLPSRYLAWWRASRVLQDYDFQGAVREIIDEFPQFSFLLADLHPHVLAIPFLLLGIAISLNLFHGRSKKGLSIWGINMPVRLDELLFAGLCLGSLGFLNIWDFPFAVLLFTGVYLLKRFSSEPLSRRMLGDSGILFFLVILTGVGLYLPFYLSFASQAGGLVPSLIYSTRGAHFWVMFGSLLTPVIAFMVWRIREDRATGRVLQSLLIVVGLFTGLFFLMLLAGWVGWMIPITHALLDSVFNTQGQPYLIVLMTALQRRLFSPGAWLTLMGIAAGVLALLGRPSMDTSLIVEDVVITKPVKKIKPDFILVVMVIGLLLLIIPEFFYLRDQFGWRMNTIFKFYYHAWILLSVCAAYAFIRVMSEAKGRGWAIMKAGMVIILIASLVYAPIMLDIKTNGFGTLQSRTLDGNQYFKDYYPDEAQAIEWLSLKDVGVVAEAIGGSYTGYARVSILSGFPTVLGWPGHESQWRGGDAEMGTRFEDINLLYATNDWSTAEVIIQEYGIRYIFIGNLERDTYHVSEAKFRQNLSLIYEKGSVVIFEVYGYTK